MPVQLTFLASPADSSVTVISVQVGIGVGERNSIPLFRMQTAFWGRLRVVRSDRTVTGLKMPEVSSLLVLIPVILVNLTHSIGSSMRRSPFNHGRAPGESCAKNHEQDQVAPLNPAGLDGLVQRNCNRGGG